MVGAKEKLNFVPWSSEFTIKLPHGSASLKKQKGFTSLILIYEEGSPLIINPISGTRHKQSIPEEIERWLDHTLFDHEIKFTTHAGHASELTKEAAENGVDIVVAVGGDGTVNEVARSLVHTSTALGIIPCGSGNGLARHLQISQTPRGAIEILNQNVIHCLDYGKINGKPFFCTCGMGFDAFVSKKFADSGKRGLLQYAKNTIGVGLTYQSEHYILEYNGQKEELDAFFDCVRQRFTIRQQCLYRANGFHERRTDGRDCHETVPYNRRGLRSATDVHQDITEQQPRATFPNQEAPCQAHATWRSTHRRRPRHDGLRH